MQGSGAQGHPLPSGGFHILPLPWGQGLPEVVPCACSMCSPESEYKAVSQGHLHIEGHFRARSAAQWAVLESQGSNPVPQQRQNETDVRPLNTTLGLHSAHYGTISKPHRDGTTEPAAGGRAHALLTAGPSLLSPNNSFFLSFSSPFLKDKVSCSPGWTQTHCVAKGA